MSQSLPRTSERVEAWLNSEQQDPCAVCGAPLLVCDPRRLVDTEEGEQLAHRACAIASGTTAASIRPYVDD